MNLSEEIRKQIEKNKGLKLAVGEINNHLSILENLVRKDIMEQVDEAYQKGFEDGKAIHEKGCEGCKYGGTPQGDSPCYNCSNYYQNNWTAKDDKIEVGDEVTHKSDSVIWKAVCIRIDGDGRHMNLMGHTGAVGYYPVDDFKKTGRHFDIQSISEALNG